MKGSDYTNLAVTPEDHAEIDEAIPNVLFCGANVDPWVRWAHRRIEDRNPANPAEVIAQWHAPDWTDVRTLFDEAYLAQQSWRQVWFRNRIAVMRLWASAIEARLAEFIAAMVLETGKPRCEAKAEACEAVALIRYYADIYEKANGYTTAMITSTGARSNMLVYRPLGVFAVITPFNFPLALPAGMCVGALLTGNTVVFKPSPDAPLTGALLYQTFMEACTGFGISSGAFQFVVSENQAFEQGMRERRKYVAGLAFVGSTNAGFHLKRMLEEDGHAVKVIAELGGKNACIVTPNIASLERMGRGVALSAFGCAGQKCSACSVLVIHESLQDAAIAAIVKATEAEFVMGDPREHDVTLGPLINAKAYQRYLRVRETLVETSGAKVIVPAIRKKESAANGYFAAPVIASGLPSHHPFHQQELFVPVLCVRTYSGDIREAVEIANSTEYGLTAGIFTNDAGEAAYFTEHMEAGVLYVNRERGATTGAWPGQQPFAGWKNSGIVSQFGVCGPDYLRNFVRGQSCTEYE